MRVSLVVRMVAPVVAVSVLLLGVGLVTAWYVERLQQDAARVLAHNVASIRAAGELEIGLRRVRSRINTFRLTGDRTQLDAISAFRRETDRWLQEAVRLGSTEREQTVMAKVGQGYERFFRECDRLVQIATDSQPHEEHWNLVKDVLHGEILEPAHEYLDINAKLMAERSKQSEKIADRMVLALLLLGTTGPVAGLLAGFGIARGVSRSIVQLSVPVRDAAGKLNQVVGPVTISAGASLDELETELRGMAEHIGTVVERFQQSQREMLRAEQLAAVGQLAAGVAHELRNPLMSIKLLVQSAAKAGEAASLSGKDLEVVQVVIARLERSLQSLLDFARPPKLEKRRFELAGIVQETVRLVMGRAERQGVQIECDLPTEPVAVWADVGQMRQVLLNLLLNALDAVPSGGKVQVHVHGPSVAVPDSVCALDANPSKPEEWAEIEVRDTGCGLSAELGDRIFEPFVSSKETGTGLGLTISRQIIEAHGGQIEAANGPEGGAIFTVRLPFVASGTSTNNTGAPC